MTATEYPTAVSWNGLILGGYVRNSSWNQRHNNRAEFQRVDMGEYAKARGYAVRWFEERGISGVRMHRRVMLQTLLGLITKGEIHGILCADISRLSRDERLLDPLVIAETLRQHAEGRLLTYGGELDLRRSDDLRLYTILAQVASAQRQEMLTSAAQGYKVAVQKVLRGDRPVFRKGKVMIGRIITTLERNLADEPALAALTEEFDRQPTLTAVVGALHRRGVVGPSHATDGYTWTSRLVREILNDPLYAGVWTANRADPAAGRLVNADCLAVADTEYAVPHLAWWQASQRDRWRAKFLASENVARAQRHPVPHPLLGLALCAGCGAFLGAFGAKADAYAHRVTYRCPPRVPRAQRGPTL